MKYPRYLCNYELSVDGKRKPICEKCFISTFDEINAFINQIILKKQNVVSGIIPDDQRGKRESAHKILPEVLEDVVKHIKSFPAYESHYCRQSISKMYLASDLTTTKMNELYKETRAVVVSQTINVKSFMNLV